MIIYGTGLKVDKDEKQVSNQLVVSYTLVQLHVLDIICARITELLNIIFIYITFILLNINNGEQMLCSWM